MSNGERYAGKLCLRRRSMDRKANKLKGFIKTGLTGRRRVISFLLASLVFSFTFVRSISAQTTTGSISGTVTDATGSVIPNAAITVTGVQTGIAQSVQSNGS